MLVSQSIYVVLFSAYNSIIQAGVAVQICAADYKVCACLLPPILCYIHAFLQIFIVARILSQ